MRPLKLIIKKDIPIFFEWYVNEIKKDINTIYNKTISKDTYISPIKGLYLSFKKVLFRLKYLSFFALLLFIISLGTKKYIWSIIWFIIALIIYGLKYWVSGEPLKYYKDTYYNIPEQNRKV